jgi:succinoglycan biosynthesis protein ExoA
MRSRPAVSVVVPARADDHLVTQAVASALEQDYPGPLEVVVATDDPGSVRAVLPPDPRVRVVANPSGTTPAALNAAIRAATGDVIARVDAHAQVPSGYLRQAVGILHETGAANVGGVQDARGDTPFERAVAAAMASRFGAGDATYRHGSAPGLVDTVYLGVFRRDALDSIGGFDETLLRNQDYELNYRLRAAGELVYFHPDLRVQYRPRSSVLALARQYADYGAWKRVVLRRHPASLRWRQLVAPAAVVANMVALGLAVGTRHRWALGAPLVYGVAVGLATASAARAKGLEGRVVAWLPLVFATMHHAWGSGFLWRRVRSPSPAEGAEATRERHGSGRMRSVTRGPRA